MTAMRPLSSGHPRPLQHGLSLIELVIFMVVLGAALAGVLRVFVQAGAHSADPLQQRQALAIAESLLEEIELMPFTICDPDDPAVGTASNSSGCTVSAEAIGPEGGETRFVAPQFDNVNDYHGHTMNGIVDITNTAVSGLSGYAAAVSVAYDTLNDLPASEQRALRITVSVTTPGGSTLQLDGYRVRSLPNAAF